MTGSTRFALVCVVCLSTLGCQYGLRRDVLRQQAAEDLSCPPDDVTVTHGSEGYRASGCGEDVQYDCPDGPEDMTEYGDRSCTLVRRTVGLETAGDEAEGQQEEAAGDEGGDDEGEGADGTDDEADDETAAEGDVTQPQGEDGDGDDGDDHVVEGEAEDGDEEDEQDPEASGSEDTDGGPGSADAGAEEPQG